MLLGRLITLLLYHIPQAKIVHANVQSGQSQDTDPAPLVTLSTLKQALKWSQLWPLARTALPLCVVMLLINLHIHVPRYFLADLGEAQVGYFAAVASLAAIPELVTTALGQSAVRQLAIRYAQDQRAYLVLAGQLLTIGAALGLAGILGAIALGRPVLSLLFRPEYAAYADVLIWLMVARMVMNVQSFLGYSMTAARWFKLQIWTYGLMLVSLFVAAWFMIPKWGSLGAAWATLTSACITLVVTLGVAVLKYRKDKIEPGRVPADLCEEGIQ
jgi:O-antigen/teichoic acid export membrane protein